MNIFFKNLLLSLFNISLYSDADFVWMIHPLNMDDILSRYGVLKFLPKKIINFLLKVIPPIVLSEVKNIVDFNGVKKRGYIMGCFLTTELIHDNKSLVTKKVYKSAKMARLLGAKLLVIGGLISVDKDNENKINSLYGVSLSNGAATATMVMEKRINEIVGKLKLQKESLVLAIINAGSTKGFLISQYFSSHNFKKILFVDNDIKNFSKIKEKIKKDNIEISTDLNKLVDSDLVIIAPSYKRIKFESSYFKNGVIIYDTNDPHYNFEDVSKKVFIRLYSNGLVNIKDINYNYNLGISKNAAYVCLTESFLLTMANDFSFNYFNNITIDEVKKIKNYFNKSHLSLLD
jgi:predicted amino acid dehydrogenase